jgi:hypothetical protein
MAKVQATKVSTDRTDTNGLENLFDVTVSVDNADSQPKRIIEVSISEAAQRLKTTERTIWRRIERGELKSRSKGNKRLVKIPVVEPVASIDTDGHTTFNDTSTQANAVVDLKALLHDLQSANYRLGYLESELKNHQDQVKLLPDLVGKAAEAEELRARAKDLEAELERIKATWWYRFWCWLTKGSDR